MDTENTGTDLSEDNPEAIAQLLTEATAAAEPGALLENPVLNEGTRAAPLPTVVTELKSAGYMYIWDTESGERSLTNKNMLPTQLKKLRPNGKRYFTTIDPGIRIKRGTHRCMLHPENANREHYDNLGFALCFKSNLANPYQVRRHMQKRHKDEYTAIQEEIADARREEDRDAQKLMMQTIAKVAEGQAKEVKPEVYVSDADKKKEEAKVKAKK